MLRSADEYEGQQTSTCSKCHGHQKSIASCVQINRAVRVASIPQVNRKVRILIIQVTRQVFIVNVTVSIRVRIVCVNRRIVNKRIRMYTRI